MVVSSGHQNPNFNLVVHLYGISCKHRMLMEPNQKNHWEYAFSLICLSGTIQTVRLLEKHESTETYRNSQWEKIKCSQRAYYSALWPSHVDQYCHLDMPAYCSIIDSRPDRSATLNQYIELVNWTCKFIEYISNYIEPGHWAWM